MGRAAGTSYLKSTNNDGCGSGTVLPGSSKEYAPDTDVSTDGVGAVLLQRLEGQQQVVAYHNKTLSTFQHNYCITRRKLLVVMLAVAHFEPHLYGSQFKLKTDHASLKRVHQRDEPSLQAARWLETLTKLNFHTKHRARHLNGNADGLCRK